MTEAQTKEMNLRYLMHGICWGLGIYVGIGSSVSLNPIAVMVLGFIWGVFVYGIYRYFFVKPTPPTAP